MAHEQILLHEELLKIIRDAIRKDQTLRMEYQMGDKFRFIRDRLTALLQQVEASAALFAEEVKKQYKELTAEEKLVYVYLYNAHGVHLFSWQKMVAAGVFYEYSVNRPIYAEKKDIEALLRTKTNSSQHGYLTIAVSLSDILPGTTPDALGNALIKVKEGSLHFDKLMDFTTNGVKYAINVKGELIKKE